ncbi:integrase catalytic domain-containing protein [Trichonephila inaurata madagascariensis]|uniref:Integrase catalytic domain-containing protein n=1 Tax=Trichonephila inaurata madagascariensis TaxID=2747483 RepID=A0A8X6X9X1_9ARAC|nr:integrase catalytic domain-containing protein [Trichonephila inaurata madagascariensis]
MVQNFIAKERIIWKNIIERSPWWEGFYEHLVRSVKESLHKILGKALLSFEEMTTILNEIEAVLNLKPLSYMYEENEPRPLTPMHFLNFGQNQPTYPVTFAEILENASTKSYLLKRKKYQQLLLKQPWHRWKKQYLLDLRTAHSVKNPETYPELKVGDVVLIKENTKNKFFES